MAKSEKQALAKAQTGTMTVDPALAAQLADLKTDGFENVKPEDTGLPIINILQSNSPQCDKKKDEYDPNVSEGEFYNTLSRKSMDGMTVVPVGFTKAYIEFVPRTSGGGYVGRHSADSPVISQATKVGGKLILPSGNELVETAEHFIMVLPDDGPPFVALLPLKSTQLRHSRRWLSEMGNKTIALGDGAVRAPMFFQKYRLTTGVEENSKGAWHGLTGIEFLGFIEPELLEKVRPIAESFSQVAAKASDGYAKSAPGETVDIVANME